ncbi:MAG: hypothetical protein PHT94_00160 [Candidatus Nanoarchaeia archaeon]|nr:hypothetical protein [Candidatus Nanoarchaeia archaeon]
MNLKNFDFWDIGLTKLSVFFATLFLISVWSSFRNFVVKIHWIWFLVIALLLAIKPMITVFKK